MVRYMLFTYCGDCQDPLPFDIIAQLGYNPGINGHTVYKTREDAEADLEIYKKAEKKGVRVSVHVTKILFAEHR